MQDIIEQPSERDEQIYEAWQSGGKTHRALARQFETSLMEIDIAIDRCMLPFTTATRMRAFKRENQRLENVCAYYYAKAMAGDLDSAHVYARCSERLSAINGWSSVNIKLDPVAAQAAEQPSQHEQIKDAIMRIAKGPNWRELVDERLHDLPASGSGKVLAPPTDPSADDENL
jgi:hypothetical protein